jgi:hypothetical protein
MRSCISPILWKRLGTLRILTRREVGRRVLRAARGRRLRAAERLAVRVVVRGVAKAVVRAVVKVAVRGAGVDAAMDEVANVGRGRRSLRRV